MTNHQDLFVFQQSLEPGQEVFRMARSFPREEMDSRTDQVRRSSRRVSANLAEAWRKRRDEKHVCSTLNVAEAEAAETQVWLQYAVAPPYVADSDAGSLVDGDEEVIRMMDAMIHSSTKWCLKPR